MAWKVESTKINWEIKRHKKGLSWQGPPWTELSDDELLDVMRTLIELEVEGAELIRKQRGPLH
jgi:hypothetical protein